MFLRKHITLITRTNRPVVDILTITLDLAHNVLRVPLCLKIEYLVPAVSNCRCIKYVVIYDAEYLGRYCNSFPRRKCTKYLFACVYLPSNFPVLFLLASFYTIGMVGYPRYWARRFLSSVQKQETHLVEDM